jgi:hypothetical protein
MSSLTDQSVSDQTVSDRVAQSPTPEGAVTTTSGGRGLDVTVVLVVALAAVFGALERLWLLIHLPLLADEAVVGLMARAIDGGHFTTFYWGQNYGGLEPYVVAVVGQALRGPVGVNATSALLSGVSALLVGLLVTEISGVRRAGLLAGALVWVWPYASVWNSTRELGFHFATAALGLALLYGAVRISHGHRRPRTFLAMGLCAGAGWWASPEIVYFAVPAAVILVGAWHRLRRESGPRDPRSAVLFASGVVLGSLPWIYTNITTGFASLSPSSAPATATTYTGRMAIFFHHVLPTELGLKELYTGAWVGGSIVGKLAYAVALLMVAAALVVAFRARRRSGGLPLLGCGMAVVLFPFAFAADTGTGYWSDARYGVDFSYLVAIVVFAALADIATTRSLVGIGVSRGARAPASGAAEPRPPGHAARLVVAFGVAAVVAGAALTAVASHATAQTSDTSPSAFFDGWHNPNRALDATAADLQAHHIRDAYSDYWIAYDVDYANPWVAVSPAPPDPVRAAALASEVADARRPAWLFLAPAQLAEAVPAFSSPEQGPDNYTEASFLAFLVRRGVASRVVHLGVLDAVIPDQRVTLPSPSPGRPG